MHIVQRGISGNACFFEAGDYARYLRLLALCAQEFACLVHAYCLMTNHVHLLITPNEVTAAGRFMKHLGQCYVQRINERLERSGTLWEGRYYSCLLNSDRYVLACYRYIELNPVRAGMVRVPEEYEWSSYVMRATGGVTWLAPHVAYESLGDSPDERFATYRSQCHATDASAACMDDLRRATRLGCVAGTIRRGRGRPPRAR